MFKNLSYNQLNVLLQIGAYCPHLELKYLEPLAKYVAKQAAKPITATTAVDCLRGSKPDPMSSSWFDILTKADYEEIKRYISEAGL